MGELLKVEGSKAQAGLQTQQSWGEEEAGGLGRG